MSMTWKKFKELVDEKIKDDEEIWWIDVCFPSEGEGYKSLTINNKDDLGFTVGD